MFSKLMTIIGCLAVTLAASAGTPKYVFYFIGDGMGLAHVLTAETYNRTVLGKNDHLLMLRFPVVSVATSYSADSKITDSAASGTALATGTKTKNGMLGQTPDTVSVISIARELKDRGYGVAIATSVPPDDATPAAFYAHQPSRKMFYEIGMDMAASGYDMFAGSHLRGVKTKDGKDTGLIKALKKSGYTLVYGEAEYEKNKNNDKLILLDNDSSHEHIGFTIDSLKNNLHLPFITKACIEHMQKVSPDKFFMMIEGGNIDWAAHSNDGGAVVKEILNFNESLQLAYDFYLQHPDETLILVTADHNTGGMSLGVEHGPKEVNLKNIDYQRVSIEDFSSACRRLIKDSKNVEWEWMKKYLADNLGLYGAIAVNEKQDKRIQESFNKSFNQHSGKEVKTLYSSFNEFVATVFDVFNKTTGIGWTTTHHCGDFTPVYAIGKGSEIFNGLNDNALLPVKLRTILDIK